MTLQLSVPSAAVLPSPPIPIQDRYGRSFRNLRVSLTAACNYACSYCVPNGKRLLKASDELDEDLLLRAIHLLRLATPINRLRITGGEPLVANKFESFLAAVMQFGMEDVSITTNGQLVLRKLDAIQNSGVKRINVSLDSLNPLRFRRLARGGDLDTVLGGVKALLDLGIRMKINMVPLRECNAVEVLDMLEFCLDRGMELRYIELMRMGHLAHSADFQRQLFTHDQILAMIGQRYQFEPVAVPAHSTALRYSIPGRGIFGVIANESQPFCAGCDRLRLSSDGRLYGCLSNQRSHDLKPLLALKEQDAVSRLQTLLGRVLGDKQVTGFTGGDIVMKMIGG